MRRVLKWVGWSLLALVIGLVAIWGVSRIWPMPAPERQALAQLDAPLTPLDGSNGFAALWSLHREVPPGDQEQLLAADVKRMAALRIDETATGDALAAFPSLDQVSFAPLDTCGQQTANCLATIRSARQDYRRVVEARRPLAARVAALDDYAGFRSPYPPRPASPLPAYSAVLHDLTVHAFDFVDGRQDQALTGVCRDASIGRKLASSADMLIGSMIGVALVRESGRLLVDMLSELPPDHPLPQACGRAFQADGLIAASICPAMLGEGRYAIGFIRSVYAFHDHGWWPPGWLFLDREKTAGRSALHFAWACSSQAKARALAGRPLRMPPSSTASRGLDCVANVTGCMLSDMAEPVYGGYAERMQDADAQQRLVAAWLWLRSQPAGPSTLAERLAALPPAVKIPGRGIVLNNDNTALRIQLFNLRSVGNDASRVDWQLPVPAWMRGAPQAVTRPSPMPQR